MAIEKACFDLAGRSDSPPLIIFEEEDNVPETKKRLEPYMKQTVYYMPTLRDQGTPKTKMHRSSNPKIVWNIALRPLKWAGVTSVILGGMFLEIVSGVDLVLPYSDVDQYRDMRSRKGASFIRYDLRYCLGTVIKGVSGHFERVQISALAHPHGHTEIRNIENRRLFA